MVECSYNIMFSLDNVATKDYYKVMDRVSRREFIQHTSKYMKNLPVIITNRGDDDLVLQKFTAPQNQDIVVTYSCGCVKDGGKLCSKHNRS